MVDFSRTDSRVTGTATHSRSCQGEEQADELGRIVAEDDDHHGAPRTVKLVARRRSCAAMASMTSP